MSLWLLLKSHILTLFHLTLFIQNHRSKKGDQFLSKAAGGGTETHACHLQWNDLCRLHILLLQPFDDVILETRKPNVFFQNLLSSLNARKLRYLLLWWNPDDCHIYSRKRRGKEWNKFWYNVIVFIRVFWEKMRRLIIFIARAVGNLRPEISCRINVNCWWLSDITWHFRLIIYWSHSSSHLNVLICLAATALAQETSLDLSLWWHSCPLSRDQNEWWCEYNVMTPRLRRGDASAH